MRIDERLEDHDDWEKETVLMALMSGWCHKQFTSGLGRVQECERLKGKVISALVSGLLWGKTTELWVNHFLSNWCGRREKRLDLFHCRKLHLFEFTCSEWEVKLHVCELPLALWTYTWLRDTYDASYSFVVFLCVLQSSQLIQVLCIHHWEQVTFTHKCKVFNSILFIQSNTTTISSRCFML